MRGRIILALVTVAMASLTLGVASALCHQVTVNGITRYICV